MSYPSPNAQKNILNSLVTSNWVHISMFFYVSGQLANNNKKSVEKIVQEFKDFMNWTEDDCPTETLKRNYYNIRDRFYKESPEIKSALFNIKK